MESEEVLEYALPHRLGKLNWFEKALLAERLSELGKTEEAQNLTASMLLPLKNYKQSGEDFKRFFETILNAKKIDQKPGYPPPPPPPMAAPRGYGGGGMEC